VILHAITIFSSSKAAFRAKLVRRVAARSYVIKCCGKSRCLDGSKRNKTYQVGLTEMPADRIGRANLNNDGTYPGGIQTDVRVVVMIKFQFFFKYTLHMRL
jgi:hypothetical protein